jgi:sporulation protein YlmC with PRC-barrel domain
MDIQLNAPVVSRDGADLGKIDRVIFDPQSGQTTHIVVHKCVILARDVAVPVEKVRVAAATRVELDMAKTEVEDLPDFVEADYAWPPETWTAPYGWPAGGVMWPMAYAGDVPLMAPPIVPQADVPEEVRLALEEREVHEAVVGQGAEVVAIDGAKVGSVQNVLVDPVSHKPSSVIVRRGVLFAEDVEIPGDWVASVDDQRVALNVDKVTVEQLAKHKH